MNHGYCVDIVLLLAGVSLASFWAREILFSLTEDISRVV